MITTFAAVGSERKDKMGYIDKEAYKEKYLCCGYLPEMSEEEFDAFPEADVVPVESGNYLMLPCQIGDIVYDCDFGMVNEWKIMGFSVGKVGLGVDAFGYSDDCEIVFYAESTERQAEMQFPQSSIGDDVFLTREEAEMDLEG